MELGQDTAVGSIRNVKIFAISSLQGWGIPAVNLCVPQARGGETGKALLYSLARVRIKRQEQGLAPVLKSFSWSFVCLQYKMLHPFPTGIQWVDVQFMFLENTTSHQIHYPEILRFLECSFFRFFFFFKLVIQTRGWVPCSLQMYHSKQNWDWIAEKLTVQNPSHLWGHLGCLKDSGWIVASFLHLHSDRKLG